MIEIKSARDLRNIQVKENLIDKVVGYFSPTAGSRRMRARFQMALAGAYSGASKRKQLSTWKTSAGDADSDILGDLETLRDRSRDLIRNNSLATGILNTKCTSIVGTGLKLRANIDREITGLTEDQAVKWERQAETEFKLWADSKDCDITGINNFDTIQELSLRSTLENGDCFILTPMIQSQFRTYQLQLQMIEADRICNKDNQQDTETLAGGVEKDKNGRHTKFHILNTHPGAYDQRSGFKWRVIDKYGARTNRLNVIHLYKQLRIGQTRGVPDLAPVIEELKQLGRYTEAEVTAAVVSSFFTVFVKSEGGGGLDLMQPTSDFGGSTSDKNFKMGSGAILDLNQNEAIEIANPMRPNTAFDAFVLAISRQIGAALELPFEIVVKHFTASYSASRGAMLEAWRFYMSRRKWLADNLCRPVYELLLTEAVAMGRLFAPGFLDDPLIRMGYLGSEWVGPSKGQIDELKEVNAAEKRLNLTLTSLSEETAAMTGGDWEKKIQQIGKEKKIKQEAMGTETVPQPTQPGEGDQDQNQDGNQQQDEEIDETLNPDGSDTEQN